MASHLSLGIRSRIFDSGGGATTDQLRGWGLSPGKIERLVRDGHLVRVARGCYRLPSTADDDHWAKLRIDHLKSLAAQVTVDAVAGLRTAGMVWGLPVSDIPNRPEAIRPPRSHRPRGLRTVCTVLAADDVAIVDGLAVTTMERTAVDVAVDLPIPQALVTLDAALARGARRDLMLVICDVEARWPVSRRRGRQSTGLTRLLSRPWSHAGVVSCSFAGSRGPSAT